MFQMRHTLHTFCLQWVTDCHTLSTLSVYSRKHCVLLLDNDKHALHTFCLQQQRHTLLTFIHSDKHTLSAFFVHNDKCTLSPCFWSGAPPDRETLCIFCLQWQTNSQHCLFAVTNTLCTVCLPWKIHCALFVCQVQSPIQGCSTWYSSKNTLDLSALFMCKAHRPWKRHSKWCRDKHMLSALFACQVDSVVKVCSWCRRDKDTSFLLG